MDLSVCAVFPCVSLIWTWLVLRLLSCTNFPEKKLGLGTYSALISLEKLGFGTHNALIS